jgi:hypothetical protein
MLKPGLGKGLGDLMNGDQVAGKKQDIPGRPEFGRGMQTLVRPDQVETSTTPPAKAKLIPAWFYFGADVLLLFFVVAITFDAARPFDAAFIAFCAVAITIGAILAIVGVFQSVSNQ